MKKKLNMYLIYFIYIFEFIYTMSTMYFNSSMVTHKIEFFENIYQSAYCMIFIVGILYILLLIYKVGYHETVILVTHDQEIASIADRVITIEDGKIIQDTNHI